MSPNSTDVEAMEVIEGVEIERANGALLVDIRAKGGLDLQHDGIKLAKDGYVSFITRWVYYLLTMLADCSYSAAF